MICHNVGILFHIRRSLPTLFARQLECLGPTCNRRRYRGVAPRPRSSGCAAASAIVAFAHGPEQIAWTHLPGFQALQETPPKWDAGGCDTDALDDLDDDSWHPHVEYRSRRFDGALEVDDVTHSRWYHSGLSVFIITNVRVYSQDTRSKNTNNHCFCAKRHLQVDQNLDSNSSDY